MTDLRVERDPGVYPREIVMQINENITNGKVMEIVKNCMVNIRGNIADLSHLKNNIIKEMEKKNTSELEPFKK